LKQLRSIWGKNISTTRRKKNQQHPTLKGEKGEDPSNDAWKVPEGTVKKKAGASIAHRILKGKLGRL